MSDIRLHGELDDREDRDDRDEAAADTLALIAALRAVPVPDPGEEYGRLLARKIEDRAVFAPGGTGFAEERGSAGRRRAGGRSVDAAAPVLAVASILAPAAVLALAFLLAPSAWLDRPVPGDSGSPEESGLLAGLEALSGEGGRTSWELPDWSSAAASPLFEGDIEETAWIPFEASDPPIDAALESLSVEEEATLLSALESAIRSARGTNAADPPEPA